MAKLKTKMFDDDANRFIVGVAATVIGGLLLSWAKTIFGPKSSRQ